MSIIGEQMSSLEAWLCFYLDKERGKQECWTDGENITEALIYIDPEWFSKIRLYISELFQMTI